MCGFAGFVGFGGCVDYNIENIAKRLGNTLLHRGPDDGGVWLDKRAELALVHQRLSILDLSLAGHQPMISISGRFVIVLNGEIYNHLDLRNDLDKVGENISWRGRSDTETLLAYIETFGLNKTLERSVGMFSFALWDTEKHTLYLVRDRIGEKPLYYGLHQDVLLFGSELKALKEHPSFSGEIDRNAIALQMRHNYIPAPYSIYKSIKKLQPGTFLKLKINNGKIVSNKLPEPTPYWSLNDAIYRGINNPFVGSDLEAANELNRLLQNSVRLQMLADVPLGAFLSGGIDSSLVVALMQEQSSLPVKTFTIGFDEEGYNEAFHAKAVANHLGTEHTELYVSPRQALDVIPHLSAIYDEPFSDSSQIPTFLVSEMTKQHVTVSLSGDGGDELFGGYARYSRVARLWSILESMPSWFRNSAPNYLRSMSVESWNKLSRPALSFLPIKIHNVGDKIHKLAGVLNQKKRNYFYRGFVSHWENPASLVINGHEIPTQVTNSQFDLNNIFEQMMAIDSVSYLPDDILVKVDRAAMRVSLETRVPMLDHRVVEFAWRLPLAKKIYKQEGKKILRKVLSRYMPSDFFERPKMGFGVPLDRWLRGPLRDWAEDLLDESRLRQEGFFRHKPIRKKWAEHLDGQRNWQYHLWDVLMFQSWIEKERKR